MYNYTAFSVYFAIWIHACMKLKELTRSFASAKIPEDNRSQGIPILLKYTYITPHLPLAYLICIPETS